jgi:hypothetical protein
MLGYFLLNGNAGLGGSSAAGNPGLTGVVNMNASILMAHSSASSASSMNVNVHSFSSVHSSFGLSPTQMKVEALRRRIAPHAGRAGVMGGGGIGGGGAGASAAARFARAAAASSATSSATGWLGSFTLFTSSASAAGSGVGGVGGVGGGGGGGGGSDYTRPSASACLCTIALVLPLLCALMQQSLWKKVTLHGKYLKTIKLHASRLASDYV